MNDLKLFDDEEYKIKPEPTKYRCRDCEFFFEHMYTRRLTYCKAFPAKRTNAYGCLKVKRLQYICEKFKPKPGGQKVKLTLLLTITLFLLLFSCTESNYITNCEHNENEGKIKITYKINLNYSSNFIISYLNQNREYIRDIRVLKNWEYDMYLEKDDAYYISCFMYKDSIDTGKTLEIQVLKNDSLIRSKVATWDNPNQGIAGNI